MSTYYQIFGGKVNVVSADPSNPIEGQIWYNTTSEVLKYRGVTAAAWATGGNMATARNQLAGCGTQTAGLGFGGYATANSNATEEYGGTSWTAGGNMGTARNGKNIQGLAEDLVVNQERAGLTLVFTDNTQGWLLQNN